MVTGKQKMSLLNSPLCEITKKEKEASCKVVGGVNKKKCVNNLCPCLCEQTSAENWPHC